MRTAYRIKKAHREAVLNRQRRFALGFCAAIVLFVWFLNVAPFGAVTTEAANESYISVPVMSGDTVWTVAREYKPAGADTRDFARKIALLNDVDDYIIHEGQILKIPN